MTRVLPRTSLHSSKLIRCLADLALIEGGDSGNAFAEKLAPWINFSDALPFSAVHGECNANKVTAQAAPHHATPAVRDEFERTQAQLANSIIKSFSPGASRVHNRLPAPEFEQVTAQSAEIAAAYAPYRRFYEAHQRDMELSIQPLRSNVREALAKASPRLRQLAVLDATLEKILRERESKLLARVPLLLKSRFEHLFKEQQHKPDDMQQTRAPAGAIQAGGWLAHFCNDMQMLLLAEMEFRLQPAMGLIEAFKQDTQ